MKNLLENTGEDVRELLANIKASLLIQNDADTEYHVLVRKTVLLMVVLQQGICEYKNPALCDCCERTGAFSFCFQLLTTAWYQAVPTAAVLSLQKEPHSVLLRNGDSAAG